MEQREKVIDKTPAQKIRDYFKEPKWRAIEKANLIGKHKFK